MLTPATPFVLTPATPFVPNPATPFVLSLSKQRTVLRAGLSKERKGLGVEFQKDER
ncbi:MAG: hypothetical protein IMZ67_08125 [Acidobacteria bacterium]|nr:hypothetical protein [Acidobacteriota bacterium]